VKNVRYLIDAEALNLSDSRDVQLLKCVRNTSTEVADLCDLHCCQRFFDVTNRHNRLAIWLVLSRGHLCNRLVVADASGSFVARLLTQCISYLLGKPTCYE
jgi:hypothetical protein